ncbi:MAG: SH3 domain-containing protein [Anaerolineae bacterium]|nr:SH3 domain-containing protein [Anaerolineae bacterium]
MKSRIILVLMALLVLAAVIPAQAQDGAVWNVSFYNNTTLTDPVVASRQDNRIAFNWGGGSPASGVNANNFSARWGTDVNLPAGNYRFWVLGDDNVRVTVDFAFNPLIDTFSNPAVGQLVSADVTLTGGSHHIQVDYREVSGDAYVYLDWANLSLGETGPDFSYSPPVTNPVGQWTAQYYANANLSGNPSAIITEGTPTHNWGSSAPLGGLPADNFSVRWTSSQALTGGTYRITTRSDDGVRVYVNGSLVINQWQGATGQTYTADVTLGYGTHTFVVEYYEAGGDAFIDYNLSQISTGQPPVVNPPVVNPPVATGNWIAYYYNNRDLAGSPSAIVSEATPTRDWGSNAPIAGVGADNFSVRWISSQNLSAGTYRISVRADDGVRVYVDGQLRINEWHDATNQTYTVDLNLTGGLHTFTVEFYEAQGVAFIDFNIGAPGTVVNPPTNTGASATVTAYRLNVRNVPTTTGSTILTKVDRGETYPVVGKNATGGWYQINVNGTVGWAYGAFLEVTSGVNIPVTSGDANPSPPPASTGFSLAAKNDVNIRSMPNASSAILGVLRVGRTAPILGRNLSNTWWLVNYNGTVGWVSGGFIQLQSGVDIDRIPVR